MAKAIVLILALRGPDAAGEHSEARLRAWMKEHRAVVLKDACSKQYDSVVESARHFGHGELKEVFIAQEQSGRG